MSHDGEQTSAAGDETTLGPLGHLPLPSLCSSSHSSTSSTTLLAPTSISDTITDVSPFIPLVLDLAAHNYYHWRHLFLVHLGRCGLRSHLDDGAPAAPNDLIWVKDDFAILQWIYTRISTELFGLLPKDGATAAIVWAELRRLFQDNRDARINHLETAMRTIKQRNEPVGTYCQRLKAMADELRELGRPVDDRTLTTTTLAGISEHFNKVSSFILLLRPAPPYSEVRSMLQLEELNQWSKMEQPQAFYSNSNGGGPSPPASQPQQPAARTNWQPRPAGVSPNYKGKNPIPGYQPCQSNNSGNTSSAAAPSAAPTAPPSAPPPTSSWRPQADPWMGLVQAWPVPWAQGAAYGGTPWTLPPPTTWQPLAATPRPVDGPGLLGRPPAQAYSSFAPLHHPAPTPFAPTPFAQTVYAPSPLQAPMSYAPSPTTLHQASAPNAPSSTVTPTWDQAAFIHAMNAYTNNNDGGWILDSGASAHMSGNPGPSNAGSDRAAQ